MGCFVNFMMGPPYSNCLETLVPYISVPYKKKRNLFPNKTSIFYLFRKN